MILCPPQSMIFIIIVNFYIHFKERWISNCIYIVYRGVFQNLVEKHLPAPDRLKIQKLLGIPLAAVEEEPQPGSSSSKGKPSK